MVTGSANRTCCPSIDCRTGDCCVGGGVGCGATVDAPSTGVVACSSVSFGAGFAGGADAGGAAGRRRGGALGAAFLPDVAELMSVDIVHRHRRRVIWTEERGWDYM